MPLILKIIACFYLLCALQNSAAYANNTTLNLSPYTPTAKQIGRAASQHLDNKEEKITLKLKHKGLKGPVITLIRSDLEKALNTTQKSPEEIWHNTLIEKNTQKSKSDFFDFKGSVKGASSFRFVLQNQISLSQSDTNFLYRSSLLAEYERPLKYGFLLGGRARLNIADNLSQLSDISIFSSPPLRADEAAFAGQTVSVDQFYSAWLHSINSDLHLALTGGYLEEMFSAYGGEILYRPLDKNFAIGIEAFQTQRRLPDTALDIRQENDDPVTAHLNLFYEVPNKDTTFYLKAGRYLAGDYGVTTGLQKRFKNGIKLDGFITATNAENVVSLNSNGSTFGGVSLTFPIGDVPYIPDGSEIRIESEPFGRSAGQTLDRPLQLYEVTEPLSARQLQRSWHSLLD